jgi:sulfur carrier protein ThiS
VQEVSGKETIATIEIDITPTLKDMHESSNEPDLLYDGTADVREQDMALPTGTAELDDLSDDMAIAVNIDPIITSEHDGNMTVYTLEKSCRADDNGIDSMIETSQEMSAADPYGSPDGILSPEASASETAEPAMTAEPVQAYEPIQAPAAEIAAETAMIAEPSATAEPASGTSNPVVAEMVVYINDKPITLKGKDKYIFVNIFDYYEFDLSESGGRSVITRLNGESAPYTAELKSGDKIELGWQE